MRFAFTEDQNTFRDAVRDVLARECPPTVVRDVWTRRNGIAAKVYATLAETGVVGCTASEAGGGMGMTPLDTCLSFEEIGFSGAPGPYVETTAYVIPLLEAVAPAALASDLVPRLAAGELTATVARTGDTAVAHATVADLVVVVGADSVHLLRKGEGARAPQVSVDRTRDLAAVGVEGAALVASGPSVAEAIAEAELRATVATSAVLVGLSRRMLDLAVEYAKVRHQFGRPIGSFQAVKHKLSDSLIAIEFAKPMVYRAAYSLTHDDPEKALHASMAKIYASESSALVAKHALQVHGAIGYTIECDLHFFMKRAWALAASCGDTHTHRRRVADAILGPITAREGA